MTRPALPATSAPWPHPAYGWYTAALLAGGYFLSFLDRAIINVLIEPIKADQGFSDTQIGLLVGLSFALFYAIGGLPAGWLADKTTRKWIIVWSIAGWCAATAGTGIAHGSLPFLWPGYSLAWGKPV
jgi:MFS family permease